MKSAQEPPNGYAYQPMLSYSIDGGVTFAPPVNLPESPPAQFVSKSTDQGKTWTHARMTPPSSSIATYIRGGIA